jgi:multidrug resistance efflux pump
MIGGIAMVAGTPTPRPAKLPALRLVQSSRNAQRLAKALLVLLVLAIIAMAFVPWQQSARGTGKVVAFIPQERQQTVTSAVEGIVVRIADGLVEGARVKRGDFIVEVEPNAANLVEQIKAQLQDLEASRQSAETKAEVYGRNVKDFEAARDAAVDAADEMIAAAKAKWDSKKKLVEGYKAKELQARQNYERQFRLFERGVKAAKEVEMLKEDWDVAISDLSSAELEVLEAENQYDAKVDERQQKLREAEAKVDYARAMEQEAIGQVATKQKDIRALEIKQDELKRLVITAPRDGTIFRVLVVERGQMLKKGAPLFTLVPDTSERAVEMWVSGNDISLVRPGNHVRLQFEGWPAVQFAGWPSVAVGTFGGELVAIDATDDGTGKFRVLVRPVDKEAWPSERFLRQGARANGWVMLNQVPLGYEIWRQLNGFPPVISKDEPSSKDADGKKKVPLPK